MGVLVGSRSAVDPESLARWCLEQNPPVPVDRWHGRANTFRLEPGRGPGRGWVLLRKLDLDNSPLTLTADMSITFVGEDARQRIELKKCTLLSRECIVPGARDDANAVYLVELEDRRYHLTRKAFADGYKAYNVSGASGSAYLAATINGSTAWTWQEVVNGLVTILGEQTSEFVLPFTPHGTPENLVFDDCGPWEALNRVLDRLACTPVYDPVADVFAVVRLGADGDTKLNELENKARTWDGYSSEEVRGWRPAKVKVRFPRRPQPTDGASPYYTKDISLASQTGVVADTCVLLDDDMTALGASGAPTNQAALDTRAQERADDWERKRQFYERPILRVWRDFLPEGPGLAGYAAARVIFDDRGGPFQTAAVAERDWRLEHFKPLGKWPVWWPFATGGGGGGSPLTTKGDIYTRTASGDTRLPVGFAGIENNLYPDPSTSTGLRWGINRVFVVRAATTQNITSASGTLAVDGVTLNDGDLVLVKNQSSAAGNRIYIYDSVSTWGSVGLAAEYLGLLIYVTEGSVNSNTLWTCTTPESDIASERTFACPTGVGTPTNSATDKFPRYNSTHQLIPRSDPLFFGLEGSFGVVGVSQSLVTGAVYSNPTNIKGTIDLTAPGGSIGLYVQKYAISAGWIVYENTTSSGGTNPFKGAHYWYNGFQLNADNGGVGANGEVTMEAGNSGVLSGPGCAFITLVDKTGSSVGTSGTFYIVSKNLDAGGGVSAFDDHAKYGVFRGTTAHRGVDGTLADGSAVIGGIVTSIGTDGGTDFGEW